MLIFLILTLVIFSHVQDAVGQTVHPMFSSFPDNTAVDLGAYTCKKPAGDTTACQGITDYSTFVYHPGIHKLLMFGGGHATTFRDDVDVFDFSSLTWGHGDVSTPCTDMTKENQTAYGTWATTGHPHSRHTY